MLNAGLPIPFWYVAKKEMQKIPFLGWVMTASGMIFIDRENKNKAIRSMRMAGNKIKNGKNVLIFPEGTFFENKPLLLPFKKGAFHLAIHSKVPILPVAIIGADTIWPADNHLKLKPGTCKLVIGEPIITKAYQHHQLEDLKIVAYHKLYELLIKETNIISEQ
jgi:1-acyl-sn-glycerol-3-phosphate acyltransferase